LRKKGHLKREMPLGPLRTAKGKSFESERASQKRDASWAAAKGDVFREGKGPSQKRDASWAAASCEGKSFESERAISKKRCLSGGCEAVLRWRKRGHLRKEMAFLAAAKGSLLKAKGRSQQRDGL
jgi:hypothetical protein